MATVRPWWQFAKTPSRGFAAAGIWVIVALFQLLSVSSGQGRVWILIATGGAVATLVLVVGNIASGRYRV